jgi:hypothetical protein
MDGREGKVLLFPVAATITEPERQLCKELLENEYPYQRAVLLARQGEMPIEDFEKVFRIIEQLGGYDRFIAIKAALNMPR